MFKNLIKRGLNSIGIEFSLKKNLWYLDAYAVQKRLVNESRPVIFDVGASEGSVTQKYKELYPHATIHAFEPQPESFLHLSKLAKGMNNVHCNNVALASTSGVQKFYKTIGEASSSLLPSVKSGSFVDQHTVISDTYEVTSDTLDHYAKTKRVDRIDILKMDVQGYELQVLQGASDLLSQNKIGLIYSEIWFTGAYQSQAFYEDIALYLRKFGYFSFGIYNMHWDTALNGKNLWADAIFVKTM